MHERICINSNCFPGAGLAELAPIFAGLRPSRISLLSPQIGEDPAPLRELIADGGYVFESIVHPFLYGQGLDGGPAVIDEARETLWRLIDRVAALGCRSIYLGTGPAGTLTWEQAADRFADGVAPCVAQARGAGLALMVENVPQLYADMSLATSLRDAVTLAERADIGVCIDVFGSWTEAGLEATIARAMPRCGLIQLSDLVLGERALPGRAVPGDGSIPLKRIVGWALAAGYAGAFDLEITGPRIVREGAPGVARAADYVGGLLAELGA